MRAMSDFTDFERPGDELEDDEYPDEPDDDNETETAFCPKCGAEVYEDAVRCPVCEAYITPTSGSRLWTGRSVWWIVLGALGVAATIAVLFGF